MIGYSYKRSPGGARYSGTQRRAGRLLAATGAPPTLSSGAIAAMTARGGIRAVVDVLFEVESNRLRRPVTVDLLIAGATVAPSSGTTSSIVNGRRTAQATGPDAPVVFPAAPAGMRAVRETWTQARLVNVVEVHGATATGQITSVRISTLDAAGAATLRGTFTSSGGRMAAQITPYDAPATCYGILVEILDTTAGNAGGACGVVEVDPMLIRDISEEITDLDVQLAGEADPASTTSPVGNYLASTCSLTLEDVDGQWNPAINASLDVGHRVEIAFGMQFGNLLGDSPYLTGAIPWTGITYGDDSAIVAGVPLGGGGSELAAMSPNMPAVAGNTPTVSVTLRNPTDAPIAAILNLYPTVNGALSDPSSDPISQVIDPGETATLTVSWTLPAGRNGFRAYLRGDGLDVRSAIGSNGIVEELLPAGVFYTDPFDTDSDATTVTINGSDRLGRNAEAALTEQVKVGQTFGTIVTDLARNYLDLDVDQVAIDGSLAASVIPYAYPSGNLGSYLADLIKAFGATLYMDPLDRLVAQARSVGGSGTAAVAKITDSTSMIGFKRPAGYDLTTSIVTVTATPLTLGADAELWAMPSGGIQIPVGGSYTVIAQYDSPPALNGYVTGIVADGSYSVASAAYYADRAEIKITNTGAGVRTVADLRVRGNPLVEATLTGQATHQPSVDRYGPRSLAIDAKLAQTQGMVDQLAQLLLDSYRSIDDNGKRRLPEITINTLGLPYVTAGDKVTLVHVRKGLSGDYVAVSRGLTYSSGALLLESRCREAPNYDVLTLDAGELLDDGHVVG